MKKVKIKGWDCLAYFQTGEWQVVEERLNDQSGSWCPDHGNLFAGLAHVPCEQVRVVILGQDPYPQRMYCTGTAFSIPRGIPPSEFPASLVNIFREYSEDLGYPLPHVGDLTPWCEQGVLLWNVYPSCTQGKPGSHHWLEWEYLTKEIVEKLDERDVCFILLGASAGRFDKYICKSRVIKTSHPSPLGCYRGFSGSRIFSRANTELANLGQPPINWRLDHGDSDRVQHLQGVPTKEQVPVNLPMDKERTSVTSAIS